ncbi:hypothetical protein BU23DRAFT_66514 [Bimuria novae-zelandiae CBS 107.79]|uniref:Chitin-binding type-2 domain-containing protein n=1 Tax=Bimuria novae-zelandiae CBS 107.79 TaxID=1447943 RepID=A0A6A5VH05_9PLEO|nr:hypothetical protein BU23DRAFT_66514 [Bimuria novae-zelandiae CBS 107.79]
MKLSLSLLAIVLSSALAQTYPECTAELVRTDDCAGVINANACYNKFRWNAQTLTCIEGKDDAEKKKRACKCCNCVGKTMCDWVTKQKYNC